MTAEAQPGGRTAGRCHCMQSCIPVPCNLQSPCSSRAWQVSASSCKGGQRQRARLFGVPPLTSHMPLALPPRCRPRHGGHQAAAAWVGRGGAQRGDARQRDHRLGVGGEGPSAGEMHRVSTQQQRRCSVRGRPSRTCSISVRRTFHMILPHPLLPQAVLGQPQAPRLRQVLLQLGRAAAAVGPADGADGGQAAARRRRRQLPGCRVTV